MPQPCAIFKRASCIASRSAIDPGLLRRSMLWRRFCINARHELEAARLFGAETALREITGVVGYMKNRANWSAELELARQRVGAAAFDAEFAYGKSLPLADAIKFALSLHVE